MIFIIAYKAYSTHRISRGISKFSTNGKVSIKRFKLIKEEFVKEKNENYIIWY